MHTLGQPGEFISKSYPNAGVTENFVRVDSVPREK